MGLFVGSLGNFGAKARAVGLSTFTTSCMPSKPTDLGFFNVLSIERQSEPDPAHIRDFCEKCESEQLWRCIIGGKAASCWSVLHSLQKGSVHRYSFEGRKFGAQTKAPFLLLSTCPSWSALRWTCCKYQLHHQHSGKGGSKSAPQPLIDTIVLLICVTFYKKGPRFSHTVESRSLQHLPRYTDGDRPKVLPRSCGPPVIPPLPSLPPPALLPPPPPLLRERFPEYHDWTASKRKRPVEQLLSFHPNKRLASGKWARGAGAQMRRNALLPLLPIEMEPGEAVKAITQQAHPFAIAPLEKAVKFLRNPVAEIRSFRVARMREFERAAEESLPGTMQEIESIKDQPLQYSAERTATRSRSGEPLIVGLRVQALRFGCKLHGLHAKRLPFNGRDRTISPLETIFPTGPPVLR